MSENVPYFDLYAHTIFTAVFLRGRKRNKPAQETLFCGRVSKLNYTTPKHFDSRVKRITVDQKLASRTRNHDFAAYDKKVGLPAHTNDLSN